MRRLRFIVFPRSSGLAPIFWKGAHDAPTARGNSYILEVTHIFSPQGLYAIPKQAESTSRILLQRLYQLNVIAAGIVQNGKFHRPHFRGLDAKFHIETRQPLILSLHVIDVELRPGYPGIL